MEFGKLFLDEVNSRIFILHPSSYGLKKLNVLLLTKVIYLLQIDRAKRLFFFLIWTHLVKVNQTSGHLEQYQILKDLNPNDDVWDYQIQKCRLDFKIF